MICSKCKEADSVYIIEKENVAKPVCSMCYNYEQIKSLIRRWPPTDYL